MLLILAQRQVRMEVSHSVVNSLPLPTAPPPLTFPNQPPQHDLLASRQLDRVDTPKCQLRFHSNMGCRMALADHQDKDIWERRKCEALMCNG